MTTWQDIREELRHWQAEGLFLPIWWRDDDAIEPTPELEELARISGDAGLPVHLAIIPAHATAELATRLSDDPLLIPATHGLSHANHAPADQKKAEFGDHRAPQVITSDLAQGAQKMAELFGAPTLFVPPWNRIGETAISALSLNGYRALSTYGPRKAAKTRGLWQINTHVDPIDWHSTRSAHPDDVILPQLLTLLQDRRAGRTDNAEPLGLLTHHLVHDAAIWDFTKRYLDVMLSGPIRPWRISDQTAEGS